MNCKPYCHITTGFSGAGAFSDGKLSLSYEVGGDFPTLIGEENAQELINYTDKIYLEFGADTHVEGKMCIRDRFWIEWLRVNTDSLLLIDTPGFKLPISVCVAAVSFIAAMGYLVYNKVKGKSDSGVEENS